MTSLKENIENIKQNINTLCKQLNKNSDDIQIVTASKTVSAEILKQLKGYGINICGENRVQEFLGKYNTFDCEWHFIGKLQTNKVKYIIDKITLLHSLDRIELAAEIDKQCIKNNIKLNALIEINIAGEQSKGGIAPENALEFYNEIKNKYANINLCGIMSVMPVNGDKAEDKYYLQMKDIYDKIKKEEGSNFRYLSMGMSDDYLTAISCGSNMIRLGRAIFGERHY